MPEDVETPTEDAQERPETPETPDESTTPNEPVEAPEEAPDAPEEAPDAGTPEPSAEEPEAEPEPPPGLTPESFEKNMERTEREGERHRKRLAEIWGEEEILDFQVCPACQPFAGMRPPLPWPDEDKDAVRAFIGDAPDGNYREATDARRCDSCDGLGLVRTGSRKPDQITKLCSTCGGHGWTPYAGGAPPPAVATTSTGSAEVVQHPAGNGPPPPQVPTVAELVGASPPPQEG